MIAAMMMAAAAGAMSPVSPSACVATLCDADRLRPYFERLAAARGGGEPVRIVQIGDSHTAADQLTGAWRAALQARYGMAGRGMLAPGRPYQGYLTRGVTAAQSPGWSVNGIFGASYAGASGVPIGLSAYSATTAVPGAWLSLAADGPGWAFDKFTLCGWMQPGAGSGRISAGATSIDWMLSGASGPACQAITIPAAATVARVTVLTGPVTLTSWSAERVGRGGVTLSNLGTVGAQLIHFERTEERTIAAELAVVRPDLIVVAFGTNEAFKPGFSAATYDADLQRGIRRVRRLAPGVPILLLGAPDSATALPPLRSGADGIVSTCPAGESWAPTAALATVQAIQRRRAHDLGIAYWDWAKAMGGRCTADGWVRAMPAMMRGDHVHFTKPGADEIARRLQADLDAAAASPMAPAVEPYR